LANEGHSEHSYQDISRYGRQRVFWLQMIEVQSTCREDDCAYERGSHSHFSDAAPVHEEILAGKEEKRQDYRPFH
jgi:hypothetical protein